MPKHALRQDYLVRRKQLGAAEQLQLSLQAQQRLLASDHYQTARLLALYSPINNEVQTAILFNDARTRGKRICYPRLRSGALEFVAVTDAQQLSVGRFGVAEPQSGEPLAVAEIDLLVVPGVAFDRSGHRLGYGKGFYDRELARVSARTISVGLCFDFQLCAHLPYEAHDQPVQFVVTDLEFISCRSWVAGSP